MNHKTLLPLLISACLSTQAMAVQTTPKDLGHGINYAASHYYNPLNTTVPSNVLEADFSLLSSHFNTIRTYSINLFSTYRALREAQRFNMGVVLGLGWAYGKKPEFDKQFKLFTILFTQYPDLQKYVKAIIVGNEVYDLPMANDPNGIKNWLADVSQVRDWVTKNWKAAPMPFVTISERANVLEGKAIVPGTHQGVGAAIVEGLPANTPIFANIYPFWGGCTATMAVNPNLPTIVPKGNTDQQLKLCITSGGSLSQRWDRLQKDVSTYTGKHAVILGETGWPTNGDAGNIPSTTDGSKTVKPSIKGAELYWDYIYGKGSHNTSNSFLAKNPDTAVFAFSAFDEPIKGSNNAADLRHYWGTYNWSTQSGKNIDKGISKPLNKTVNPTAHTGTYVNFAVTADTPTSPIAWAENMLVLSGSKTYDYKQWNANASTTTDPKGNTVADGTTGYPWIKYNQTVTLEYRSGSSDIKCSNTLMSGDGIGGKLTTITPTSKNQGDLVWKTLKSPEAGWCQQVTWSNTGVWMPKTSPASVSSKAIFILMSKNQYTVTINSKPSTLSATTTLAVPNKTMVTIKGVSNNCTTSATFNAGSWSAISAGCSANWKNEGQGGQTYANAWLP